MLCNWYTFLDLVFYSYLNEEIVSGQHKICKILQAAFWHNMWLLDLNCGLKNNLDNKNMECKLRQ